MGAWWARCLGALRRGWQVLVPLMVLTQVLPALLVTVLSLVLGPYFGLEEPPIDSDPTAFPEDFFAGLFLFVTTIFAVTVLVGLVQGVGWAGGSWVIARQAAGEPVSLAEAMRYGLRRALGVWGWSLLVGLLVMIGICFCILPGIYLAAALSMAGPVYVFERHNPIGRSFRMFHDRLGLLLSRLALVVVIIIGVGLVADVLETVALLPFGDAPLAAPGTALGALLAVTVLSVLSLPGYLAQLVGLVVTYAEQRIHEGPVDSARLAAELG
ncbi:hypothetical protein [Micromonospora fluostatini]|uniref:hypothetical protein n=1 Tax=Micromonospora sp. JCM 30529 TaxID=3421643 RepID=UPI003D16B8C1